MISRGWLEHAGTHSDPKSLWVLVSLWHPLLPPVYIAFCLLPFLYNWKWCPFWVVIFIICIQELMLYFIHIQKALRKTYEILIHSTIPLFLLKNKIQLKELEDLIGFIRKSNPIRQSPLSQIERWLEELYTMGAFSLEGGWGKKWLAKEKKGFVQVRHLPLRERAGDLIQCITSPCFGEREAPRDWLLYSYYSCWSENSWLVKTTYLWEFGTKLSVKFHFGDLA